jgi:hypothetical protein
VFTATYNFYLYQSGVDNNLQSKGGDTPYPSGVCQINSFLETQCTNNTPILDYGLYNSNANGFTVGISMTAAPTGSATTANYGYAGLPDSSGNCPVGLIPVRPWFASPASIIVGSPDGTPEGEQYPTSFINSGGTLNDTMVEAAQPPNFAVTRMQGNQPCDGNGNCGTLTFGSVTTTAESVAYQPNTPIVCAIPASLLSGLF